MNKHCYACTKFCGRSWCPYINDNKTVEESSIYDMISENVSKYSNKDLIYRYKILLSYKFYDLPSLGVYVNELEYRELKY